MADTSRCPICGIERPSDATEGPCPRCATGRHIVEPTAPPGVDPTEMVLGRTPGAADTLDATAIRADVPGLTGGVTVRYFGDYELRKELGRGGMGVVYRALQVSLNRPVALKMIKAGVLADESELRRFQNEAEAVALLDHPGIVPVYEVGEHDGQRYFSMKLVEGGNLASRLSSFKDNPRAAAGLMAETAEAVHHAHMRGILHRDLKPANILIDAEGRPHVTDFGLAKRVEGDVEMTQSGAILGTPAYMSPEQAHGRRGTITTATDIYGLGAILYALLAGKAPFGGDGVVETLDAVRSRPPEPPSKLNPGTPRDLETICLKCLEKDPRRRYTSADALAEDLNHWLDSRPIAARRVGAGERAWLWCRRKPVVAALAAAVVVAAVAGTAAVIAVQANANRSLRAKNAELTRANDRVRQRFELANSAIKLFHGEVGDDLVLKADQFKPLRDKLLRGASDFYVKLEGLLEDQPDRASRRAMGNAYFELGELCSKIGDKPAALAAHRKGLAVRRGIASATDAVAEARGEVALSLHAASNLLHATGRSAEALAFREEARDLLEALPPSGPGSEARRALLGRVHGGIGWILASTGRPSEAMSAYASAIEIQTKLADDDPGTRDLSDLAGTTHNAAMILAARRRTDEALAMFQRARSTSERAVAIGGKVAQYQLYLANHHNEIGLLHEQAGRPDEALRSYESALRIRRELADDNPAVTEFRSRVAGIHHNIGALQMDNGRPGEAMESYRLALAIRRKLADENPTVTEFRGRLATIHHDIAILHERMGRPGDAMGSYRESVRIQQALTDANPSSTEFRSHLADGEFSIGVLQFRAGDPIEALAAHGRALGHRQRLARDSPSIPEFQDALASSYAAIAEARRALGRDAEARGDLERAVAIREAMVQARPKVAGFASGLASAVRRLGSTRLASGDVAGAVADARKAAGLYERLPSRSAGEWFELACCHAALASVAGREGSGLSLGDGEAEAAIAMNLLARASASGFRDARAVASESAIDPLRNRRDFRLFLMDLAMPADPFAR